MGANVTLNGTGSTDKEDAPSGDPTGTKLTYEWNLTSKPSTSALTDSSLKPSDSVAKPYFFPDKEGVYVLKLSLKDSKGKWSNLNDEDAVTITVLNAPPVPDAGSNRSVSLGANVTLDGTGSTDLEGAPTGDPAGTKLNYDWNVTSRPTGSSIIDTSLKPSDKVAKPYFYPDREGTYILKLSVQDPWGKWSDLASEDPVTIKVSNLPPNPDAGTGYTVYTGEKVTLNGTASTDPEYAPDGDPEGDLLSYDWNITRYPPGSLVRDSSLQPSDGAAEPYFYPDKPGKYTFSLAVRDRFGKWSNRANQSTVLIDVLKPNDPPVADAGVDIARYVETFIYLNGSRSYDIDGSIIHYNWTCTSHAVDLTFPDSDTPFFYADAVGTYTFTLKVQDDNLTWSSNEDRVIVTVFEPGVNLPPSADAGADQQVILGATVVLNGSESSDPDGQIISWNWTCISHPGIVINNRNSSSPSFIPEEAGSYIFTLMVTDDNSSTSTPDEVVIVVESPPVNSIPVAVAGDDLWGYTGDLITLDGSESYDIDGLIMDHNWTCLNHTVEFIGSNTSKPGFIPSEPGEYVFSLSVMDDKGAWSLEDIVVVLVWEKYTPPPIIQNVTPYIGPFLFDDGSPVGNANITLSPEDDYAWGSDWTVDEITSGDGYAYFGDGIPPGNYTCTAYLDNGSLIGTFPIEIFQNGSFLVKDGVIPKAPLPPAGDDDDIVDDDDIADDDDIVDDDDVVDDDDTVDDDIVDDDTTDDDTMDDDIDDDTGQPEEETEFPTVMVSIIAVVLFLLVVGGILIMVLRKPKVAYEERDWEELKTKQEE
jgi:hypothetical protein